MNNISSGTMFSLYANFLSAIIAPKEGETNIIGPSGQAVNYISHLLSIYARAESMGCITEDLACKHVSLHLQLRQLEEARKLAAELCSGKLAESVELWVLRITIEIRYITRSSATPSDADLQTLFELFQQSLMKVSASKSYNLWLKVLLPPISCFCFSTVNHILILFFYGQSYLEFCSNQIIFNTNFCSGFKLYNICSLII